MSWDAPYPEWPLPKPPTIDEVINQIIAQQAPQNDVFQAEAQRQADLENAYFQQQVEEQRQPITAQEVINQITAQPTEAPNKSANIDNLVAQIKAQGTTDKWTGGYGADAATKDMARILDSIGITDINQFGPVTREVVEYVGTEYEGGPPVYETRTEQTFGNKETGQAVPVTYSERQKGNAWGGTFEGKGNTGYRVDFTPDGKPVFYTTGASSSNIDQYMPIIQLALMATGAGGLLGNALLGTGASQVAANALGGALLGGGTAALTGQDVLKGALIGGAGGALQGYLNPATGEILSTPIDGSIPVVSGVPVDATGAGLPLGGTEVGGITSGTGLTAGAGGLGLNASGAGLGAAGTGAGITAGTGLTGTGVLTGSTLGTNLLGTGAGVAGLTGTGILAGSELGKALLGTTSTTPLVGTGVLTGSQLGSQLLGTGANTAATVGGVTGLTNAANVGAGALNTGVSTGITGLGSGAVNTGINPSGATTGVIDPTVTTTPAATAAKTGLTASDVIRAASVAATIAGINSATGGGGGGFPIVPIPTDWTSPIKPTGTTFTPLAPIDFGSRELLRGTQWERLLSPDYGKAPAMPSNMTIDDLTRILGGSSPQNLSINDVIAGIQNQYGQTTNSAMGQKPT